MKNKWLVVLGVLLVLGFTLAGCDTGTGGGGGGGGENSFVGTWTSSDTDDIMIFKADMTFSISNTDGGNYTVSGKTAILNATYGSELFLVTCRNMPMTIAADGTITNFLEEKFTKVS
jgi:hypothetical protein